MKSSLVVLSSFLLTSSIGWIAYNRKKQFYPTVVYLTNNQPCLAILFFQCAVLLFLFAKFFTRIFFGRLQQAEVDNLVSQSWYAFFDMCLVFAFFQDELGTEFLFLFSVLLFVRAFHWLIEERVDYMERTPVINFLFHLRVLTLIAVLASVDGFYIRKTYLRPSSQALSVHIALGIEYFILLLNLFSVTVRYIMHSIDSMREHPWDKKAMYLLYVDIAVGIFRLALYVEFTAVMWTLHPFPLFIARPIYLSVRSLKKAVQDVLMSRRAIRYMNTVFKNATAADLAASSDTVCIICREEMQVNGSETQVNQTMVLKRLPCTHIFHASCLRSWFQRQQTCPTCRMDIIRQARLQELQGQRPQPQVNQAAGAGRSSSVPSTLTNNTNSQANVDPANFRPPWMPPFGQFPFPPNWAAGFPSNAPPSTSGSAPLFPAMPPFMAPPFFGMPIVYPGNLFPNATIPMPEPPSCPPDPASEARLRASAEARFTALRQVNVLLNAAVLQMNAYLNAVTRPDDNQNPWLAAFASTPTTDGPSEPAASSTSDLVGDTIVDPTNSLPPSEDSKIEKLPAADVGSDLEEVRKKRLEHLATSSDEGKKKSD